MWMRIFVGCLLLFVPFHVFASVDITAALTAIGLDYGTVLTLAMGAFIGIGLSAIFIYISAVILRWLKRVTGSI